MVGEETLCFMQMTRYSSRKDYSRKPVRTTKITISFPTVSMLPRKLTSRMNPVLYVEPRSSRVSMTVVLY